MWISDLFYRVFQYAKKGEALYTLHDAANRGDLVMYYQPKVDMHTGLTVGVEALMRWQHKELGLLSPAMFNTAMNCNIPVVIDLGHWAIRVVIKQISMWQKRGLVIPVSVNVMASELTCGDFCGWLKDVFAEFPCVQPSMLELEIVESSQLGDVVVIAEVINKCRLLGVKIALDDFGTAYSSLSHVRHVPSDHVKIDKIFIQNIVLNHQDRGLVKIVIDLAHLFDRIVIAEGVESVGHGLILMQMGCRYAQGYVIAKPMAASELMAWIDNYKGHPEWMDMCIPHPQTVLFEGLKV